MELFLAIVIACCAGAAFALIARAAIREARRIR
jgi:hypothetical protein